jgi:replicative DNA helicase
MIEPDAARLITRVCEALEKTVLEDMTSPHSVRQLKAGVWTLRELAARVRSEQNRIREDIIDMEQVLTAQGVAFNRELPGITDAERHVELQACIERIEATAPAAHLRALHLRMLTRNNSSRNQRAPKKS